MNIIHRPIDFVQDKNYVLECHCRINYECDCPWARQIPYDEYRADWFSMTRQLEGFYDYLQQSAQDPRTIAEIIETDGGSVIGYFWVPFCEDEESGFRFADIQDVYVEEAFRRTGIADSLLEYAEQLARKNRAKVIRSGTGCENTSSIRMHEKRGYYTYRLEFEKVL